MSKMIGYRSLMNIWKPHPVFERGTCWIGLASGMHSPLPLSRSFFPSMSNSLRWLQTGIHPLTTPRFPYERPAFPRRATRVVVTSYARSLYALPLNMIRRNTSFKRCPHCRSLLGKPIHCTLMKHYVQGTFMDRLCPEESEVFTDARIKQTR